MILIISLLAALVLGVAAVAGETAREQHSRHIVERLHTLLIEYYDTYQNAPRAAESERRAGQFETSKFRQRAESGHALAEARLYAMRELMLMEIPDRWSDVLLQRVEDFNSIARSIQPLYLSERTRSVERLSAADFSSSSAARTISRRQLNTAEKSRRNQGAECLYMIITLATGDGEARTLFGESSIGDTDGDGAPEFLDGWGHPINFLRWAPGFDSQIQLNANNAQHDVTANNAS